MGSPCKGALVLFVLVILVAGPDLRTGAWAATYYVDAFHGSDAAAGTSPQSAWQTIGKVNTTPLSPGDTVLFARGGVWREWLAPQSGSEAGAITYGAYGTGDKPLFLGSMAKSQEGHWRHEGGAIWATTRPPLLDGEHLANPSFETSAEGWHTHFAAEGGASGSAGRDTDVFASAPAGYSIACAASGTAATDIQLFTTERFAVQAGTSYELSFRARSSADFTVHSIVLMPDAPPWERIVYANSAFSPTITGDWQTYRVLYRVERTTADARITFYLGGALPAGATFFVDSLSVKEFSAKDLLFADVGNIIVGQSRSSGLKRWQESELSSQGEFWYDEDNWELKVYSAENPARHYGDLECALSRHIIDETGQHHIVYQDLDLRYGGAHGIGGGDTHHIVVRNCDFSFIGGGDQMGGDGELRYGNGVEFWNNAHDTLVEGCRLWEIYDAALTTQGIGEST
ncbi:MAG: carbohydrate binding domain-containing protein, partial [Thermodesulfobacteriota bacterium]